jgi:hypothetical protein
MRTPCFVRSRSVRSASMFAMGQALSHTEPAHFSLFVTMEATRTSSGDTLARLTTFSKLQASGKNKHYP